MAITSILRNFTGSPSIVFIQTTDDLATITTTGYITAQQTNIEAFNNGEFTFNSDDYCLINYGDGEGFFTVDLTTEAFTAAPPSGGLSDTLANGDIFVGNASNIATGVAMSGDATIANTGAVTIANNAITSAKTALNMLQYAEVTITAAQFKGMYAVPELLVAAAGANTLIVLDKLALEMTFGSVDYAVGGPVAVQYDSTADGAGALASNAEAAADFFAAASTTFLFISASGDTAGAIPFSTSVNKGLYLSNTSGAFTTGDSTFTAKIWYKVVPTNS